MSPFEPQQGTGKIKFKAISSGLGFHTLPESTAIPATPIQPLPMRSSGAVSAGPARPVPAAFTPKPTLPAPTPALAAEPIVERNLLWQRGTAYVLDTLLYWSLCAALLLLASLLLRVEISQFAAPEFIGLSVAFLAVFSWSVIAAQEIVFGTTLGKRLFDLRLEGSPIRILFRAILFLPTLLLAPITLIFALQDHRFRALHDRLSGVVPFESARI